MKIYSIDVTIPSVEFFLPRVSEDRVESIKRFRFEMDKRRGLAAEALLNYSLNLNYPFIKTPVRLERDENGKPHIALSDEERVILLEEGILSGDKDELLFSLSHSGDYAICALGDKGENFLGADIEVNKRDGGNIAGHFFLKSETDRIKNKEDFYMYWTLKESFLKATGLGLKLSLDSFEVVPVSDVDVYYRQNTLKGESFLGKVYRPFPDHTVSVCASGPDISFPDRVTEADRYI